MENQHNEEQLEHLSVEQPFAVMKVKTLAMMIEKILEINLLAADIQKVGTHKPLFRKRQTPVAKGIGDTAANLPLKD